ncbi:O-antigen ligase family protein [uncultured Paludibaculum sp.]|uniref:O-antigen ligase family protein n=1 Tax=uncultured Paludibaculum sp. TaxID=1765020 RepID=UPI002AABB4E1|nr:O-antigen ligase family protein [uncultured Paludibaculum sp.]
MRRALNADGLNLGGTPQMLALAMLVGLSGSFVLAALATAVSPVKALIGVLGAAVAVAMMLFPELAVPILCLSLPFERIGRLTDDVDTVAVSASRILGLIALASLVLHAALRKKKLHFELPVFLYGGYVAIGLMSNAWAWTPEETYRDGFRILGNLLFFFLIINAVRDYATAKRVVILWLVASMAAGLYSLGEYYYAPQTGQISESEMGLQSTRSTTVVTDLSEARSLGGGVRRLFGTTAHPTLYGLNMTMTLPFLLWAMRTNRGLWKVLCFAGILIAAYSVFLSNTRAVLLLAAFTVVFCLLRGLWRPNLQGVLALGLLAAAVLPFIPEDVYLRTLDPSLYTTSKGDSIRVRFKFWSKSWDLIGETWWHGIGNGDETTLQKMVTDEDTGYLSTQGLKASAHNEFIWVMVEVGIFGYLCFWGFVGYVTTAAFRAATLMRRAHAGEEYLFCLACQGLLIGIPMFAMQSEAFHYPLKAWWLVAPISCMMLRVARERVAVQRQELAEAVS